MKSRRGYTLLELILALGLLAALMAVAWSLMGTYRDAEQRGWKLSHRTQTIRAARAWLESDALHFAPSTEPASATAMASMSSTGSQPNNRFVGTRMGFSTTIVPSVDPIPFLQQLMEGSMGEEARVDPFAPVPSSPWPKERIDIEYLLEPDAIGFSNPDDVLYALIRREKSDVDTSVNSDGSLKQPEEAALAGSPSERVLTGKDLYRQNDEQTTTTPGVTSKESRLDGLKQAQFQYYDGATWKQDWNSDRQGGMPWAIALSFDFPPSSEMKPRSVTPSKPQSDVPGATGEIQNSFVDEVLASEPTAELPTSEDIGFVQGSLREIQIVVAIGFGASTSRGDTPESIEANETMGGPVP